MRGTVLVTVVLLLFAPVPRARGESGLEFDVRVEPSRDRQVIEGFGGSLAYWGYNADETALRHALVDLGATIVRVPAEVSQPGDPEAYRAALRRVARVAPGTRVYLTFWQPRSRERIKPEVWLDLDADGKYRLKPGLAGA